MLLLIFFQIVFAQIQEIDCDLINKLLERKYEIKQPIILLFYFKYGAIYQQIKSPWLQYSKNYTQYEFMQLDMKEYSEQCIVGIFEHNYLPYGIYINDKFEYHAELIRESGQLIEYLEQTKQFEFAPLPKFNKYRKLQNMLTNYIFIQSIKAIGVVALIIFAIWFRLQIYKDKDKSE
ncbi:unnamed protein product (macronuclear) [Paramecium tetraurelia]|uniref:Transmembrane protein n=1 Tax=Paramecium tetraurelia TaxID=5888 RepID=A0BPK6_PARTE|nr:uncharacterized protein GSPATT00005222001 [Paramecium tetraurelia]CAK60473.1 unnamed protein product [Paramecium tetraurelia]|eukprot:XP_001427871.1 hypothetical protein (macronuclear) [Paramecium tetraurelia strain d4-2]